MHAFMKNNLLEWRVAMFHSKYIVAQINSTVYFKMLTYVRPTHENFVYL